MKKITISLLFLAFSLLSFAQSAFTEKTFNDLMAAYAKDPAQFLKTETAPDFVFVALTGRSLKVSDILGMLDGSTANTWAFTNVKTRQYGATGIAVSSFAHTHTLKSGNFLSFKESLTSVFAFQQGKWVLVSWHNGPVETEKVEEEAAIKTVIEKRITGVSRPRCRGDDKLPCECALFRTFSSA